MEAAATAALERARIELLSLILAVCLASFAVKGFIAYRDLDNAAAPPHIYDDSILASLGRVAACCAEDFAVGLGCFLVGFLVLRQVVSSRWRVVVRVLAHLLAVLALCYLVVNAQIFHGVRHFLTWPLVQLAGGFHWDRSISTYITPSFKLALAVVPILTLAAHFWSLAIFPRCWRSVIERAGRPVPVVAGLLLCTGVAMAARNGLVVSGPCDFPRNPHLHFVRSLFDGPPAALAAPPRTEDDVVADLLPGRPGHTPGLLAKRPRNIILISAESVAARFLETYGCRMPTTPCLRRLDEEGKSLTFENFYATANHTIASALPIFAATYNDPMTIATVMEHPEFPSPGAPAWLQGHGYLTGFFASGGRSTWEGYRNIVPAFVNGFDLARDPNHPFWQKAAKPDAFLGDDHMDEPTFAEVRRALRTYRDRTFALWVWTYDTHNPYFDGSGPRSFPREHFPAAIAGYPTKENDFQDYLRAVWRLDNQIGELCRELEELGLADDTLIVLTGDHGEEFGEHGWFGHNWSVYEEEVRVPCVLICPRLAPLGRRSRVVGSHVDLWATITDICGLPADPRWQGHSLVNGNTTGRRAFFYRAGSDLGVREGQLKYVWDYEQKAERLYDLDADPTERHNLAQENPGLCIRLNRDVKDWAGFQHRLTKERLEAMRK
jgi:arylsulfatase A-like enzyme